MAVKSETIDRLLLSRSLIGPLRFKTANDRFTVAAHVLAAHDAAELAIAAICTELSVPGISDTRALGLPDYMGKLKEHLHPGVDVSAQDYTSKLNRVRVSLKHHGITPDSNQWGGVAEKIFGHISEWCHYYLTLDYAELDASDLIRADSVRTLVHQSRSHLKKGEYKECLEHLAKAIGKAGTDLFPLGVHVSVGQADADTALDLSGYGIDPAKFIVLQRLLPTYTDTSWLFNYEKVPKWKKTQYGHKGNWTQQNAEFAYRETVDLLIRLQQANPNPTPYLFDDVFRSVLVIKRDSPEVTVMYLGLDGWFAREDYGISFAVGDRIVCRARGAYGFVADPTECTEDPETARLVVAMDSVFGKVQDEMHPTFIFKREDVEIEDAEISALPIDELI